MEMLKNTAFALSAASVAAGILCLLLPKGSLENTFRVGVVAFLLSVVAVPFLQGESIDFSQIFDGVQREKTRVAEDISYLARKELTEAAEQAITQRMQSVLEQANLPCKKVTVSVSLTEDGGIVLREICIKVNTKDGKMQEKIKQAVSDSFGITPVIEVMQ